MTDKEKRCYKCGETKSLEEFHKNKRRADGKDNKCRECYRQWYQNNAERMIQRQKKYYKKNAEQERQRTRQWIKDNPEKKKKWAKQYQKDNAERLRQWHKQYQKDNPEIIKQRQSKKHERMMSDGTACVYEVLFKGHVKYIGETLCFSNRKKQHLRHLVASYSHVNTMLQEEFDKHNLSKDDVTLKILVEFNKDDYESEELLRDVMVKEEKRQIALHREHGIALCNERVN